MVVSFMQTEKFLDSQMESLRFSLWIHLISSFFPRRWWGSSWVTSGCFVLPPSLCPYLPALLLFLPYPAHLFWLWCQNWDLQIASSSSLHFGGVRQTLVEHDRVAYSAPMVAEEVAVSGSLYKWVSPFLSSWFTKCKFCGITNRPKSILQP